MLCCAVLCVAWRLECHPAKQTTRVARWYLPIVLLRRNSRGSNGGWAVTWVMRDFDSLDSDAQPVPVNPSPLAQRVLRMYSTLVCVCWIVSASILQSTRTRAETRQATEKKKKALCVSVRRLSREHKVEVQVSLSCLATWQAHCWLSR